MSKSRFDQGDPEAYVAVRAEVLKFFQDEKKTAMWMCTPNPLLGHIAPSDLIALGKFEKVMKFIKQAQLANQKP
jgi:uncharacterized protein (DUF2384 family)